MNIPKELNNEIWEYCRTNNIPNIEAFMLKMLKQGFTVEKYGATPNEKIIERVVTIDNTDEKNEIIGEFEDQLRAKLFSSRS